MPDCQVERVYILFKSCSWVARVQTSPLPEKKSLLPIFSEGGGTSVHRLFEGGYLIFICVGT